MSEKLQQARNKFIPLIEAQLEIYNSDSEIPCDPINVKEEWFPWNLQRIDIGGAVLPLDVKETDEYVEIYGVLPEKVKIEDVVVAVIDECIISVSGEIEVSFPSTVGRPQFYGIYHKNDVLYGKWKTVVKLNFDVVDIFATNQKELNVGFKAHRIDKAEMGNMITINVPKPSDKGLIHHRPILVV